ncbi:MAG TPA: EthD family reductase [Candidatus Binataceae bacterium]|nr:EthD family reductase [Candidatus Binataceae bacterium]
MRTVFALFNFKSSDLAAEERNYIEHHVQLARQLPGLRQYLTGRLRSPAGQQPPYYRAATLSFDSNEAKRTAMRDSPVAKPLAADGDAHMSGTRWLELESEIIVPFATKQPGKGYFMMAAEFDLKLEGLDLAAAEKRYLDHHTHLARCLPGLRHYLIGRLMPVAGAQPERLRMALLVFDDAEGLRAAYRSPVGRELAKDEEATITNARVYRIDATVQI